MSACPRRTRIPLHTRQRGGRNRRRSRPGIGTRRFWDSNGSGRDGWPRTAPLVGRTSGPGPPPDVWVDAGAAADRSRATWGGMSPPPGAAGEGGTRDEWPGPHPNEKARFTVFRRKNGKSCLLDSDGGNFCLLDHDGGNSCLFDCTLGPAGQPAACSRSREQTDWQPNEKGRRARLRRGTEPERSSLSRVAAMGVCRGQAGCPPGRKSVRLVARQTGSPSGWLPARLVARQAGHPPDRTSVRQRRPVSGPCSLRTARG